MTKMWIVKIIEPQLPTFRKIYTVVGVMYMTSIKTHLFASHNEEGHSQLLRLEWIHVLHKYVTEEEVERLKQLALDAPDTIVIPEQESAEFDDPADWWKKGQKQNGNA